MSRTLNSSEQGRARPREIENGLVVDVVDELEETSEEWKLERDGLYGELYDSILENGGGTLEASIVSGAEKVVDILEERDIPRGAWFMRSSDWDGVINTLEGEGHYPGLDAARDTVNPSRELPEAIVTARGPDYMEASLEDLGWRTDNMTVAPENGNVIIDEEPYIRQENGYSPREFSVLNAGPLTDFQRLMRRVAAENNLKMVTGKSLSNGQLTLSIEDVESTGLRDGDLYRGAELEPDKFRNEIERLADIMDYEEPEIREHESSERPWFKDSNPVTMDGNSFIYPDTVPANRLIDEVLGNILPYTEIRYDTYPGRKDLVMMEPDSYTDPDIDLNDAADYVERALTATESLTGRELEKNVHSDGWINIYVKEDSDTTVKEEAAQEIANRSWMPEDGYSFIFHMDDLAGGSFDSENSLFFAKYGHEAHEFAEDEDIDYVLANNFTDYYLTVSEAIHRYSRGNF